MKEKDAQFGLDTLFTYTEKEHPFTEAEVEILLDAIHSCKILDPACGSGAFPMGVLQKLVYILGKLDEDNEKWEARQIDAASAIPDSTSREAAIAAIQKDFAENESDYGRKLYLIENCLYGVDIQPIAIQISKLRFFISLVCDQKTNRNKVKNHGIRPLPNLETKFVAADSLIELQKEAQMKLFDSPKVIKIEKELQRVRHDYFAAQIRQKKLTLQRKDDELRNSLAAELEGSLHGDKETSLKLAKWNPYNANSVAPFFEPLWMFDRSLEDGFDIVIGNPPYISVEKFSGDSRQKVWKEKFTTYAGRGDIYCFFYERGARLLRKGGNLCYITSNKWMRAGYGQKLRKYLSENVNTSSVLDFGMAQNFGAATTYTCILNFTKTKPQQRTASCYASDDRAAMDNPVGYFEANSVIQKKLDGNAWVVLSKDRQRIKSLVEEQGVPLEDWNIQINYGIKTGYNDAFYITSEQRDALIAEDPASEELLVPLLRGRYVERYSTDWDGTWMINSHNGVRSKGIPAIQVERDYPAIWNHLNQYADQLERRYDKGDHWSNLRNCAYLKEFSKPKIIYPNMTKFLPFYFDQRDHIYGNQKCFIVTGETDSLPYLTAILNSSLFKCCFRDNFPELLGNTYELSKIFFEKIPIKKPTAEQTTLFATLVPLVQLAKKDDDTAAMAAAYFLENLIDACVMEVYFHDHMTERDLIFQKQLAPHLEKYNAEASESKQHEFLMHLYKALNDPKHAIRNQLIRLTAESPDLLAIIKREGEV